jgi:hypothetical protein
MYRQNRAGSLSSGSNESQPTGDFAKPRPIGKQRRLPEAGGSAHEDHPPGRLLVERLDQPRSGEQLLAGSRDGELGVEELIQLTEGLDRW